jgi:hypothetical protein
LCGRVRAVSPEVNLEAEVSDLRCYLIAEFIAATEVFDKQTVSVVASKRWPDAISKIRLSLLSETQLVSLIVVGVKLSPLRMHGQAGTIVHAPLARRTKDAQLLAGDNAKRQAHTLIVSPGKFSDVRMV